MTDYNDGKWHGWNGGECPVHPETVVEVVLRDETNTNRKYDDFSSPTAKAGRVSHECWENREGFRQVIAFRVIKEHREPRVFWVVPELYACFPTEELAKSHAYKGYKTIRVVEDVSNEN